MSLDLPPWGLRPRGSWHGVHLTIYATLGLQGNPGHKIWVAWANPSLPSACHILCGVWHPNHRPGTQLFSFAKIAWPSSVSQHPEQRLHPVVKESGELGRMLWGRGGGWTSSTFGSSRETKSRQRKPHLCSLGVLRQVGRGLVFTEQLLCAWNFLFHV